MPKGYFSDMKRMENEYRALILRAKMEHDKNLGPCQAECVCFQQAALLCGEMKKISADEEKMHWEQEFIRMNEKVAAIRAAIDPAYNKGNNAQSGASASSASSADSASAGDEYDEIVTEKMVKSWYKPMPKHGFDDVSGMEDVKQKLRECVADAQCNELREFLGMGTVHSFFFVGPPGCGKTFIIEAFAHELVTQEYAYLSLEGSDILSRYVGDAQKIVKRLFDEALKQDSCIIFIDEVESFCRNRASENLPEWAADITTAFLTGYNKLVGSNKNIIFIGATNFPDDVDDAMFDRVEAVRISLPDAKARECALERKLGKIVSLEEGYSYEEMAEGLDYYNYRDIDRLIDSIKKCILKVCLEVYGSQQEAIEAIKNGTFRLSREVFEYSRSMTRPSQKDNILKALDDWENRFNNKEADI